mgnify:CR=1 FL=1
METLTDDELLALAIYCNIDKSGPLGLLGPPLLASPWDENTYLGILTSACNKVVAEALRRGLS